MADVCTYYYWDHGYSCTIKRKQNGDSSVDEDCYHRYCIGYHYDDCPLYQQVNGSSSGGCFLTTACTESRGLPDDCMELQTLRAFRDNYMKQLPGGAAEVQEYYEIAPKILAQIDTLPDKAVILDKIYTDLVIPCIAEIQEGALSAAHERYRNYVQMLKDTYC